MGRLGGLVLRLNSTVLRVLEFLAAAVCLGIFSYFLAVLHDHHMHIPTWAKAVEGISGAAVIYTAFAVILTIFLGGVKFFAFLAILLDFCFMGAFVAVAVLSRRSDTCRKSTVTSVLGSGPPGAPVAGPKNLKRACELQEAVFGAAIAAAVLFAISMVIQYLLARHHQKEKRYGPGPSNNYGQDKKRFWGRSKGTRDAEIGTAGVAGLATEKHVHDRPISGNHTVRPSGETGMTGSTVAAQDNYGGPVNKYGQEQGVLYNHGHDHGGLGHHHAARGAEVTHVANPTEPVHNGGFIHTERPTGGAGAAELAGPQYTTGTATDY